MTVRARALLGVLALAASGCQTPWTRAAAPSPAATPAVSPAPAGAAAPGATDQLAIQSHLDELERKIARLEGRLGQGRGALRNGSSFLVDGGGQESVLERLRRYERELAETRTAVAARDHLVGELRQQMAASTSRGESLAEKADSLSHVQDSLVIAQQELAERQSRLALLGDQLAASELAQLRAEKAFYLVAGSVLRLMPGQTQELVDLQEQIRMQVKENR